MSKATVGSLYNRPGHSHPFQVVRVNRETVTLRDYLGIRKRVNNFAFAALYTPADRPVVPAHKPFPVPPPVAEVNIYLDTNLLSPITNSVSSSLNIGVQIHSGIDKPQFDFRDDVTFVWIPAAWDILAVENFATGATRTCRVIVSDKKY